MVLQKNGLLNNLFWKFAERISAQFVSLVVSIVLARLLSPEDYGVVAIVMVFITIANVFVSDGFGSALIQKKDASALDYCSVLYFNLAFSAALYVLLFFAAPWIAKFCGYGYGILVPALRVLSLRIPLAAVNSIQQAYVSKKMMFRKFFLSTLSGTIISGIIGVAMAYSGFGVWALVAQYLSSTLISTFVLILTLKKMPRLLFSFESLRRLFPFGARVLGVNLLCTGYQEARALIIGKLYSSADLAYYDKGKRFPDLIMTNITVSIGAVLYPKMANEQNDISSVKRTIKNSVRFSSYVMAPVMLGFAAVATPFVSLVLTDKWLPCVPFLQMICVMHLFQPIHGANMQAIKAIGRGDVYLRLELVKKAIELVVLVIVMWISVEAIVAAMALTATFFVVVNAYPTSKLLKYSVKEQMADIMPNVGMAVIMFICAYAVQLLPLGNALTLMLQIVVGIVVYVTLSLVTKNKEFIYIKDKCVNVIASILKSSKKGK